MRTVKGATADVTDQLNGELYEPCQTNNHARLNYHVVEMGLWPVQVCAEARPLPLKHINSGGEKDKPSTTNAQQCRVQPTHSDTVTQTADRESVRRGNNREAALHWTPTECCCICAVYSERGDSLCTELHRAEAGWMSERKDHLTLLLILSKRICFPRRSKEMEPTNKDLALVKAHIY